MNIDRKILQILPLTRKTNLVYDLPDGTEARIPVFGMALVQYDNEMDPIWREIEPITQEGPIMTTIGVDKGLKHFKNLECVD